MIDETNSGGTSEVTAETSDTEDFAAFEANANTEVKAEDDEPVGFDTADDNPDETGTDTPDDDWDEIDWKGSKVKVPKGAAMMQADYTRKTQELAEQRKVLETTLSQVNQASQAERQIEAEFIGIQQAMQVYNDIDWRAWVEQDPIAAQQARFEMDDLRSQAQTTVQRYQAAQGQRFAIAQQETAKRIAEGQKVLSERIKDWSGDKAKALVDYGSKEYGFSPQELNAIDDPRVILALHDAFQYRQVQSKQQQRAKVEAQASVKPVTTLKGNSGRVGPKADTNDFKAFEKMAAKVMAAR